MGIAVWMVRLLLAAVFAIAGLAKLADQAGARKSMVDFGVPAFLSKPMAWFVPLAELACAAALFPPATVLWGAGGLLGMLILFSAGMGVSLARGRKPDCHCFGQLHSTPIGWKTLVRNGFLGAMAGFVLWQGPQTVDVRAVLSEFETGLPAVAVAFGLLLILQTWTILHVLRQNGRLLLRVDALEAKVGKSEQSGPGLAKGSPAPGFSLKGLDGETVTLENLEEAGKPVVLVFAEPGCGPCEALFPDVAGWQQEHAERLSIAVISRGKVEANRDRRERHHLRNVLLQTDREVARSYRSEGTPAAVLISEGKVASGLAQGADAIQGLVVRAVLPPALKKGDLMPSVRLPDLEGREFDLSKLGGRPTVLLFWNPACGFCQGMVNDLKTWERKPPRDSPDLLFISTGEAEANRAHGFRSRMLLDRHFAAQTLFGVTGTPGSVIVDEEGRMASSFATGPRTAFELVGFLPYVPTPDATVDGMLKFAKVQSNDLVYDLGCGDGRLVIAAARDYGARGVGVDIDPQRLAEARANAKKAAVENLVKFEEGHLLDADIRGATVVTLYVLPKIMMQLRSKLLSDLRPGTRVVSHAFDMEDWKPDQEGVVDGNRIFLWTIPGKVESDEESLRGVSTT